MISSSRLRTVHRDKMPTHSNLYAQQWSFPQGASAKSPFSSVMSWVSLQGLSEAPRFSGRWITAQDIDQAFQWLRKQRRNYSIHDSTWSLSHQWSVYKHRLLSAWRTGIHNFSPLRRLRSAFDSVAVYEAEDALLLKTLQIAMKRHMQHAVSPRVYHLKNRGGMKAAVRDVSQQTAIFKYVFKSDVQSFYDSLKPQAIMASCRSFNLPPAALMLIGKSLSRVEIKDGIYREINTGIARGSALSPLLGAIALRALDDAMTSLPNTYYARYMDDWVVLCQTRSQLRKIVKHNHHIMKQLGLTLHPDKTKIGKIENGFSFLGYQFNKKTLTISGDTYYQHRSQLQQRYAQGVSHESLADYVHRFGQWCRAGLHGVSLWDEDSMHQRLAESVSRVQQIMRDDENGNDRHSRRRYLGPSICKSPIDQCNHRPLDTAVQMTDQKTGLARPGMNYPRSWGVVSCLRRF